MSTNTEAAAALRELLSSLCTSPEDSAILERLCASVVEADENSFQFEDTSFEYVRGGQPIRSDALPASFAEIALAVRELAWDGGGPEVGFAITEEGQSMADGEGFDYLGDDDADAHQRICDAGGCQPAFCYGQNWTFFDPTRQLSNGEPALAFISHEGGGWVEVKSADALNYKQIFLRMISDAMCETDFLPELYC